MTQPRLLSCPSCESDMRVVERAGVSIDRCTSCKGVFLDNGELEKLLSGLRAAEQDDDDWLRLPKQTQQSKRHYDDDDYRGHHDQGGKHRKKSALHSFLEVFD